MPNKFGLVSLILLSGCFSAPAKKATSLANSDQAINNVLPTPYPTVLPTITPTIGVTPTVGTPVVDPLIGHAWHLNNTGQNTFAQSAGVSGVDLKLGTHVESGAGILVAVSDNGIEKAHEDLISNFKLEYSKNYSLSTSGWFGNPTPGDSAHGTAVAGIIGAQKNNGKGSAGVAHDAMIAGLKYLDAPYSTSILVDQANGLYDIFNYSYGGYTCSFASVSSAYISQLKYGVESLRSGRGAIYVKAGGNEYYSMLSDCYSGLDDDDDDYYLGNANLEQDHSYPYYIVVAAVNANGISSSYSTPGSSLWISGPGGEFGTQYPAILTTDLSGCDKGFAQTSATKNSFESGTLNSGCNYTSTMNGTSAATPMVTGVVARMLQANPTLSWRDVKHILAKTATKVDASRGNSNHPLGANLSNHTYQLGWITNAAGYNFHNWYGFGLANAGAALTMAKSYTTNLGTFQSKVVQSGSSLNLNIPDNSATGVSSNLTLSQAFTVEAVQIKLNLTHSYIGDIGIELRSPSGTKSILMNINSGLIQEDIIDQVLLTNAFYGESAQGTWTLKVIDGYQQDTGKLNKWTITIYGH